MIQKIIPFDVERLDRSNVKLNIQVKNTVITVPKITRVFSTFPLKFLYTITIYISKSHTLKVKRYQIQMGQEILHLKLLHNITKQH